MLNSRGEGNLHYGLNTGGFFIAIYALDVKLLVKVCVTPGTFLLLGVLGSRNVYRLDTLLARRYVISYNAAYRKSLK